MKPFLALFNLTVRHAVRSSFFLLLVLLLFLTAAAIPATVGAGSPVDFIRVSLLYSLSAVSTILALSSVWLGCYTMGGDVESYQLHMVVSKPVSRLTIWLAKWLGVAAVNLVLLFLAALMVYFIVLGRVEAIVDDLPLREQLQIRSQIENEVLVGRRAFMPERPDLDEAVRQQLEVVVSQMRASGQGCPLWHTCASVFELHSISYRCSALCAHRSTRDDEYSRYSKGCGTCIARIYCGAYVPDSCILYERAREHACRYLLRIGVCAYAVFLRICGCSQGQRSVFEYFLSPCYPDVHNRLIYRTFSCEIHTKRCLLFRYGIYRKLGLRRFRLLLGTSIR